jgi:hypothetical protein
MQICTTKTMSLIASFYWRYTCSSFVKKFKFSYDFETFISYANNVIDSTLSSKNRSKIIFDSTMKCKIFKYFVFEFACYHESWRDKLKKRHEIFYCRTKCINETQILTSIFSFQQKNDVTLNFKNWITMRIWLLSTWHFLMKKLNTVQYTLIYVVRYSSTLSMKTRLNYSSKWCELMWILDLRNHIILMRFLVMWCDSLVVLMWFFTNF